MMSRGIQLASSVTEREQRTHNLFIRLDRLSAPYTRRSVIETIVQTNLPLSDALADRFAGRGTETEDLRQVARVGLVLAVNRFHPQPDNSFARFAVPTIVGELKRHFRDRCWVVRPPRQIQELSPRVHRSSERLTQELGRTPSEAEIARHVDTAPEMVRECLSTGTGFHLLSLDAPAGGENSATLGDVLADRDMAGTTAEERIDLQRALSKLSPRQRQVITLRFADELTQSAIAARIGVSQMQVSRILRSALDILRDELDDQGSPSPRRGFKSEPMGNGRSKSERNPK